MQWRRRRIVIHVAWGKAVARRGSSATSTALSAHRRFVFFVHILLHQMQKALVILLKHHSGWIDPMRPDFVLSTR